MEPLDSVRRLAIERPEEAFQLAWREWRATLAPEVAQVVEALAPAAVATFAGPKARRKTDFQAAWIEVARGGGGEPLATAWLASTLRERLPVAADPTGLLDRHYAQRKYAAFFSRLGALAPLAPDPVLASALARFVVDAPLSTWDALSSHEVYGPVLQLIAQCRDVRQAEVLARLEAAPQAGRAATREFLAGALRPVIDTLAAVPVGLDAVGRAHWRALGTLGHRPLSPAEDGEALKAVLWQRPDDDAARMVYSDWLTERGDARGELIALQVRASQGHASPRERRRAESLLRTHQDHWLGELKRLFTRVEFHRGFLDRAALAQNAVATEDAWRRAADSDVLRTVRVLEKGRGNSRHYARFVLSTKMENLRVVELHNAGTLEGLLAGQPRRVDTLAFGFVPSVAQLDSAAGHPTLPALRRVVLGVSSSTFSGALGNLRESRLLPSLAAVGFEPDYTIDPGEVLAEARRSLLDTGKVSEVRVEVETAECTLARTHDALALELEDRWGHLAESLLQAADGVASAVIRYAEGPASQRLPAILERWRAAGVAVEATRVASRP